MQLFYGVIFMLFLGIGTARDLYVRVEPSDVYLETRDVTVTCVFNSQTLGEVSYITLSRNGWFGTHNIVTITKGNPHQIGYFFSGGNYTTRMKVTGSTQQKFVKIVFETVDCLDEGHYECEAGGFDQSKSLQTFTDSNSIVIRSHTEKPIVYVNGVSFPDNVPVVVTEDTKLNVECDAHVGKPPETMYWYRYDTNTKAYVLETSMVGKAERRLPIKELCKWYTTFGLRFTASLNTPETRLKCTVGKYEHEIAIRVRPKVGP